MAVADATLLDRIVRQFTHAFRYLAAWLAVHSDQVAEGRRDLALYYRQLTEQDNEMFTALQLRIDNEFNTAHERLALGSEQTGHLHDMICPFHWIMPVVDTYVSRCEQARRLCNELIESHQITLQDVDPEDVWGVCASDATLQRLAISISNTVLGKRIPPQRLAQVIAAEHG